jgi:hypothetical protein
VINASNLALRDAPEFLAKEAIVRLLRQSPPLAGQVKTILSYDGDDLDDADPDNLPRPFLRLRAWPGPSAWFAAGQHRFPVMFSFELGVDGTADRDILKLWHAVRTVLSPTKPSPWQDANPGQTVLQVMLAAGLTTWEFLEAAYQVKTPGKGMNRYMYGTGLMQGQLLVNT